MTPFRAPRHDNGEELFNKVHSKARSVVERTIGILKGRWRCLLGERKLRISPEKTTTVVNVCSALHNVCIHYKVCIPSAEIAGPDDPRLHQDFVENNSECDSRIRARRIRSDIKESLLNK